MDIFTILPVTVYKNVAGDHTTLFKVTFQFRGTSSCVSSRLDGVVNLALMKLCGCDVETLFGPIA